MVSSLSLKKFSFRPKKSEAIGGVSQTSLSTAPSTIYIKGSSNFSQSLVSAYTENSTFASSSISTIQDTLPKATPNLYPQDSTSFSQSQLSSTPRSSITTTRSLPSSKASTIQGVESKPTRTRANSFTSAGHPFDSRMPKALIKEEGLFKKHSTFSDKNSISPDRQSIATADIPIEMSGAIQPVLIPKELFIPMQLSRRRSFSGPISEFKLKIPDSEEFKKAQRETEAAFDACITEKPRSTYTPLTESAPDLTEEERLAIEFGIPIDQIRAQRSALKKLQGGDQSSAPATSQKASDKTIYNLQSIRYSLDLNRSDGKTLPPPTNINCVSQNTFAEKPIAYMIGNSPQFYIPTSEPTLVYEGKQPFLRRTFQHPNEPINIEISGAVDPTKIKNGKVKGGSLFTSSVVSSSSLQWRKI